MKTVIIIGDGVKQIMFTPETDNERAALKMITPDDNIHTVIKNGDFGKDEELFGADIAMSQGGYLRSYQNDTARESVMFVLTPKKKRGLSAK